VSSIRPDLRPYPGPEHLPYNWAGSRTVALLVHGFPGTPNELRRVGAMLHESGWSVRGMLLPGFGPEFAQLGEQSNESWLRAVLAEVGSLREQYDRLLLLGNSMGAALALQAAARLPVDGLVLFSPWWRINSRPLDALAPLATRVVPRIRPFRSVRFDDPRMVQAIRQVLPEADLTDPAVQEELRALSMPTSVFAEVRIVGQMGYAAAPRVQAPVLILQGIQDPLAHPTLTALLAQRLPNLAGHVVLNAGHELAHIKESDEHLVAPLLTAFAAQIAAGHEPQTQIVPLPVPEPNGSRPA
jgi:carboxylesterase